MTTCAYCSSELPTFAKTCPQCHIPTSSSSGSPSPSVALRKPSANVKEDIQWWLILTGYGAIATGLIALGLPSGSFAAIGIIVLVSGIVTLAVTAHGTKWVNLEPPAKLAALPGIVAGAVAAIGLALVFGVIVAAFRR